MFIDAQNWRQSVKLDELYEKIDPFDVRVAGQPLFVTFTNKSLST